MGIVDLYNDKNSFDFIKKHLGKVGLVIDDSEEWEVHGPHTDMNYQVFVGPANYDKRLWKNKKLDGLYVALCYDGVYDIEDMSNWNDRSDRNKVHKPSGVRYLRK